MRLTEEQKNQICKTVAGYFERIPYKVFLYGSRVHDHLRGGDIDLLIVTNSDGVKFFKEKELDFLVQLKKESAIGQRRIDIKATLEEDLLVDPFLKSISKEMVEIGRGDRI